LLTSSALVHKSQCGERGEGAGGCGVSRSTYNKHLLDAPFLLVRNKEAFIELGIRDTLDCRSELKLRSSSITS
jgi:hypothetical protein